MHHKCMFSLIMKPKEPFHVSSTFKSGTFQRHNFFKMVSETNKFCWIFDSVCGFNRLVNPTSLSLLTAINFIWTFSRVWNFIHFNYCSLFIQEMYYYLKAFSVLFTSGGGYLQFVLIYVNNNNCSIHRATKPYISMSKFRLMTFFSFNML